MGSILGSGRSPGGGHGNSPQYSCLENPMDRGAWQDTAHRVLEWGATISTFFQEKKKILFGFLLVSKTNTNIDLS